MIFRCAKGLSMSVLRGSIVFLALFCLGAAAQIEDNDPNPLQLSVSHQSAPAYLPGQPLEIVVTFILSDQGTLTALGLIDIVPETWSFAGMRAISGDLPAVAPGNGSVGGRMEFAWITMPEVFPYSFAYSLLPPPQAAGPVTIQGQAEYREASGRQVSPPDFISIEGPANSPPEITLIGSPEVEVTVGTPFQDPGARATDKEDGDISSQIVVTGVVNYNLPGVYNLIYNVTDSGGRQASPVTRVVRVIPAPTTQNPGGGGVVGGGSGGGGSSGGGFGGGGVGGRVRGEDTSNIASNSPTLGQRNNQQQAQNQQRQNQQDALNPPGGVMPDVPGLVGGARPGADMAGPMAKLPGALGKPGTPAAAPASTDDDLSALDEALDGVAGVTAAPTQAEEMMQTASPATTQNSSEIAATMMPPSGGALSPGIITRIAYRISTLGPAGITRLLINLAIVTVLLGATAYLGRLAYAPPARRRKGGPTPPLAE